MLTLENPYIESVWNILGTIHEKGLLYKGHRVSPYCPSCQTSLSSHEVAQGYKIVKDLLQRLSLKFKIEKMNIFLDGRQRHGHSSECCTCRTSKYEIR